MNSIHQLPGSGSPSFMRFGLGEGLRGDREKEGGFPITSSPQHLALTESSTFLMNMVARLGSIGNGIGASHSERLHVHETAYADVLQTFT